MTQLTPHFTKEELTVSQAAARLGIDNNPSAEVFQNLVRLCDQILEPIRNAISRPVIVSSGYRSWPLNVEVHGSKNSDHMKGLAADITAAGMSLDELADKVRTLAPYIPLKQCIKEFGSWVHVSCLPAADADDYMPQFLIASLNDKKETVYSTWVL